MPTFTYHVPPTDTLSLIRLYAADTTNPTDAPCDFWDEELLTLFNTPEGAQNASTTAALALECLAADNARLAVVTKKGTRGNDERAVYEALLATATRLRSRAVVAPVVIAPPAVFTFSPDGGITPGSLDVW